MHPNDNWPLAGLRIRRQMAGISSKDMAKRLGITYQSYLRIERGDRLVTLDRALAMARMLVCTVEQLGSSPSVEEQVDAYRAKLVNDQLAPANEPESPESLASSLSPGTVVTAPDDDAEWSDVIAMVEALERGENN